MKISNLPVQNNKISFNGYDTIPLKGFYMQGLTKSVEQNIFKEMKTIAEKENLALFLNLNNKKILTDIPDIKKRDATLSVWAQDNKAFVENYSGKQILWKLKEKMLPGNELSVLGDFNPNVENFMPRGGEYYIGYKNNEKSCTCHCFYNHINFIYADLGNGKKYVVDPMPGSLGEGEAVDVK